MVDGRWVGLGGSQQGQLTAGPGGLSASAGVAWPSHGVLRVPMGSKKGKPQCAGTCQVSA